ncbi:hypothetical protein TRFO_42442 [Tritrichomonas foetus]|uniref:Golgi apparatus membrane protein TVP23 homolog n=1 Tax=Tritrichomonas foetus TaxID=1144522 RepID=A0A1J4L0W6_9EUKA|nr:hypothetical protein TRFO_42442 [Tritrichomonas foetus]|eukprot:OHT15604.1 hypothetical protein TRFO_42442 [Tritrichomonas foetus]
MEESSNSSIRDNEVLIDNHIMNAASSSSGVTSRYLITKFSVIFVFLISAILHFYPTLILTLVSISEIVEFWLVKNMFGLDLVGMRWSHEIGDSGESRWIFYSRPDPYVPEAACVRVFWAGLYGTFIIWTIIFLWTIFRSTWMNVFISLLVSVAQFVNLSCFLRCNNESTRQADDIARSVMLGDVFDGGTLDVGRTDTLVIEPDPEIEEIEEIEEVSQNEEKGKTQQKRELENPRLVLPPFKTTSEEPPTQKETVTDQDEPVPQPNFDEEQQEQV